MITSEQHLYQTIIFHRKLITGSIHDYLLCYCPLAGILFEVLRINVMTKVYNVFHGCVFNKILGMGRDSSMGINTVE